MKEFHKEFHFLLSLLNVINLFDISFLAKSILYTIRSMTMFLKDLKNKISEHLHKPRLFIIIALKSVASFNIRQGLKCWHAALTPTLNM